MDYMPSLSYMSVREYKEFLFTNGYAEKAKDLERLERVLREKAKNTGKRMTP